MKKMKKFLLLLPIVGMIAFGMFFQNMMRDQEEAVLMERFQETQRELNLIADQIDYFVERDNDWLEEYQFYIDSAIYSMEQINDLPDVYAGVLDDNLVQMSRWVSESHPFEPLRSEELLQMVQTYTRATCKHQLEDGSQEVLIYFRWVQSPHVKEGRFLLLVGITPGAVNTAVSKGNAYAIVALLLVTTILNMWLIYNLVVSGIKPYGSEPRKRKPADNSRSRKQSGAQAGVKTKLKSAAPKPKAAALASESAAPAKAPAKAVKKDTQTG
jgi:hypothetical protein